MSTPALAEIAGLVATLASTGGAIRRAERARDDTRKRLLQHERTIAGLAADRAAAERALEAIVGPATDELVALAGAGDLEGVRAALDGVRGAPLKVPFCTLPHPATGPQGHPASQADSPSPILPPPGPTHL